MSWTKFRGPHTLNSDDRNGDFGWGDVWHGVNVVTSTLNMGNFAVASAKAGLYNAESVISLGIYAVYYSAYVANDVIPRNSQWQWLRSAMSRQQRVGLHADEWFDRVQQSTGYPEAQERDEEIEVSPIPSVFLPYPTGNPNCAWDAYKLVQPWYHRHGPGMGPNGHEDFND